MFEQTCKVTATVAGRSQWLRTVKQVLNALDNDRGRHAFSVPNRGFVTSAHYKRYVMYRVGATCTSCGFGPTHLWGWRQLTWDHLVPKSAGGATSDLGNRVATCHMCNMSTANIKAKRPEMALRIKREHVQTRLDIDLAEHEAWRPEYE